MNRTVCRSVSLALVASLSVSLFAPAAAAQLSGQAQASYNPYQGVGTGAYGGRYDRQHGARFDPNYYQNQGGYSGGFGFTRLIPPLVGGVLGLAMGAKFGWIGAILGGAVGVFGGQAVSHMAFGDSYYSDAFDYRWKGQNNLSFIPGAIGTAIGAFMGSSFGFFGMAVGGGVGYLVGKGVAKMLFPNLYYGGPAPVPGGYGGGYYMPPYASTDPASSTVTGAGFAPETSAAAASADLADLKQKFYDSMRTYKDALTAGDETAKEEARQGFLAAQREYFDAKGAAGEAADSP